MSGGRGVEGGVGGVARARGGGGALRGAAPSGGGGGWGSDGGPMGRGYAWRVTVERDADVPPEPGMSPWVRVWLSACTPGWDGAILRDSKPSPLGLPPHPAVVSLSSAGHGAAESCMWGRGTAQRHCHHHGHCPGEGGGGVTGARRNRGTEADSIKNLSFISLLAAIPSA